MYFIFTLYLKAPPGPTPPDKDVIPLCCCKINGASFKKLGSTVTYCQALDSMDGKVRNMTEIKYFDIKKGFIFLLQRRRKKLDLTCKR